MVGGGVRRFFEKKDKEAEQCVIDETSDLLDGIDTELIRGYRLPSLKGSRFKYGLTLTANKKFLREIFKDTIARSRLYKMLINMANDDFRNIEKEKFRGFKDLWEYKYRSSELRMVVQHRKGKRNKILAVCFRRGLSSAERSLKSKFK